MRDTRMDEGRNEKVRGDFIVLLHLYRVMALVGSGG